MMSLCSKSFSRGYLMSECLRTVSRSRNFHTSSYLLAHQRSKQIGNPWRKPFLVGKESIPEWKVHWLYLMKRKAEIEGREEPKPRSDELNWNYDAELSAFAHRLKIEVYADSIKRAFTEPIDDDIENSNEELFRTGHSFANRFFELYVNESFPKISEACANGVVNYLISEKLISYIASHLGFPDLILSSQFPIDNHALYRCFFATVAAVLTGPGGRLEAGRFLNDFVSTDLLDKDIVHDIWKPKDPMKELVGELHSRNMSSPEVRLSKQSGINTVQPIYYIALFCDKELLVESAGESVIKAEADAAKLALKKLYGLNIGRYLPQFDLLSDGSFVEKLKLMNFDHSDMLPTREATNG